MAALRTFEDIAPGETVRSGPVIVTREDILAFARVYDPQAFHLDEAAAARSPLGGLAASGWHTIGLNMRLFYDGFVRHVASMGAPGIDAVRWTKPVHPGDALTLTTTVEGTRASKTRPDRGFLAMALDLRDAADETMMTQRFSMMVARRDVPAWSGHDAPAPVPSAPEPAAVAVADPMLTAVFEDLAVGHEAALGRQTFTAETIVAFARDYDPQPFHLDAERARDSHFGGLVASGWQTAACWMKHYVAAQARSAEAARASGRAVTLSGPSPGFANLRWIAPVRAGETIDYALRIAGKEPTRREGWGMALIEGTGSKADTTPAFSFEARVLWPLRTD